MPQGVTIELTAWPPLEVGSRWYYSLDLDFKTTAQILRIREGLVDYMAYNEATGNCTVEYTRIDWFRECWMKMDFRLTCWQRLLIDDD